MADEPLIVAQVMGKMVGGGLESSVLNYYRHINRDDVQYDFIVDSDSTLVPRDEIESLGGRVIIVPPYKSVFMYYTTLKRVFKTRHYHIVHSHLNSLSVFPLAAAKAAKVPVRIAHSHATMGKGEAKRNMLKRVLRVFSNVFPTDRAACSSCAGKWLFGSEKTFQIIPNAVEINEFLFNQETRMKLKKNLGLSDDCLILGNVGRLERTKNQGFLLDMFRLFKEEYPNSYLVLVGEGKMREELEAKARQLNLLDSVLFAGQVGNCSDYYQLFDVFVFPSLYEGFGMALFEAQLAGLPCLASDRIPDEVLISDKCLFLPLETGPEKWAKSAIDLLRVSTNRTDGIDWGKCQKFDITTAASELSVYYKNLYQRSISNG